MIDCRSMRDTRWYYNSLKTIPISTDSKLIIPKVQLSDTGDYYCYGSYHISRGYFLAKVKVNVYGMLMYAL